MPCQGPVQASFDPDSLYSVLDQYALPDSVRARAYEGQDPPERARLKQAIARIFALFPPCALQEKRTRKEDSFLVEESWQAASGVLCLCPCDYPSPAALLAALVPAALARVEHIAVCFVAEEKIQENEAVDRAFAALLAALDLGGFETACLIPARVASALMASEKTRPGRLVLLGAVEQWEGLLVEAARQGVPAMPLLALPALLPQGLSRQDDDTAKPFVPGLSLDSGHEGVWVWPGLVPDWFRDCSLKLSSCCS